LEDTISVRAGLEYLVIKQNHIIPLRCGLAYDPAPAIGQTNDYYTISVGSGLQWKRYALDISYQYRWGNNVNEDIAFGDANLVEHEDVERHRLLASLIIYL
jgi:long-subunit fatty acid transport protein